MFTPVPLPPVDYKWRAIIRVNEGRVQFLNTEETGWTNNPEEAVAFQEEDEAECAESHRAFIEAYRPDYRVIKAVILEHVTLKVMVPKSYRPHENDNHRSNRVTRMGSA